jgi:hypothetical protein
MFKSTQNLSKQIVIMIARICIWQPETRGPVVSGEKIKI